MRISSASIQARLVVSVIALLGVVLAVLLTIVTNRTTSVARQQATAYAEEVARHEAARVEGRGAQVHACCWTR
jgi:hypothetical protein